MRIVTRKTLLAHVASIGACGFLLLAGCGSQPSTNNSSRPTGGQRTYEPATPIVKSLYEHSDASKLIANYNSRDFGSPGWRRVLLELVNDGAVTRTFTVVNFWRFDNQAVRTLFLLEAPEALSGTNYLLQEVTNKTPEMQVNLFLPAGERRVLEVVPGNFDEGLLGSDFSYNDIRMQFPLVGYHYSVVGDGLLANEPVWIIESEPTEPQTREMSSWLRARLYLAQKFSFFLGADYFGRSVNGSAELSIVKQMRVDSLKQIDGVWTATHMTMRSEHNRWSELSLLEASFNSDSIDPKLFIPEQLPFVPEQIRNVRGFSR